jgi:hypothetical protein
MSNMFEVSAIVVGLNDPELAAILLRKYGCDLRVVRDGSLTIFVSRERSHAAVFAISAFMQRLECARIQFEYICLGEARKALDAYHEALERLDGAARSVA